MPKKSKKKVAWFWQEAKETAYDRAWRKLRKHYGHDVAADMSDLSEDEQRAMVALCQDLSALLDIALTRIGLEAAAQPAFGSRRGAVKRGEKLRDALRLAQEVAMHQVDAAPGPIVAAASIARQGAWKDKQVPRTPGTTFPGPELRSPFEEASALLAVMNEDSFTVDGFWQDVPSHALARVLACCGAQLPSPGNTQNDRDDEGSGDPQAEPSGDES